MTDIRGDQVVSRTISAIARKKFGWKSKTTKTASNEDFPTNKQQK